MAGEDLQICLELGHTACFRKKPTVEGYTHDWSIFVRGKDDHDMTLYVDRVVFNLHHSFPKPKRVMGRRHELARQDKTQDTTLKTQDKTQDSLQDTRQDTKHYPQDPRQDTRHCLRDTRQDTRHALFSRQISRHVLKEPPFVLSESGYGGFEIEIEIWLKKISELQKKKVTLVYDLYLPSDSAPPVSNKRFERLTFNNPTEELRARLLKCGAPQTKPKAVVVPQQKVTSNSGAASKVKQDVQSVSESSQISQLESMHRDIAEKKHSAHKEKKYKSGSGGSNSSTPSRNQGHTSLKSATAHESEERKQQAMKRKLQTELFDSDDDDDGAGRDNVDKMSDDDDDDSMRSGDESDSNSMKKFHEKKSKEVIKSKHDGKQEKRSHHKEGMSSKSEQKKSDLHKSSKLSKHKDVGSYKESSAKNKEMTSQISMSKHSDKSSEVSSKLKHQGGEKKKSKLSHPGEDSGVERSKHDISALDQMPKLEKYSSHSKDTESDSHHSQLKLNISVKSSTVKPVKSDGKTKETSAKLSPEESRSRTGAKSLPGTQPSVKQSKQPMVKGKTMHSSSDSDSSVNSDSSDEEMEVTKPGSSSQRSVDKPGKGDNHQPLNRLLADMDSSSSSSNEDSDNESHHSDDNVKHRVMSDHSDDDDDDNDDYANNTHEVNVDDDDSDMDEEETPTVPPLKLFVPNINKKSEKVEQERKSSDSSQQRKSNKDVKSTSASPATSNYNQATENSSQREKQPSHSKSSSANNKSVSGLKEKSDKRLVKHASPVPNVEVTSPAHVSGDARGAEIKQRSSDINVKSKSSENKLLKPNKSSSSRSSRDRDDSLSQVRDTKETKPVFSNYTQIKEETKPVFSSYTQIKDQSKSNDKQKVKSKTKQDGGSSDTAAKPMHNNEHEKSANVKIESKSVDVKNIDVDTYQVSNGETLKSLLDMQRMLMTTTNGELLQEVVDIIEGTGLFQITNGSFDFDLCRMDQSTISRIKACFKSAAD